MSEEEINKNIKKCVDEYNKNNKVNGYNVKVSVHNADSEDYLRVLKETPDDFGEYKTFTSMDEVKKAFGVEK